MYINAFPVAPLNGCLDIYRQRVGMVESYFQQCKRKSNGKSVKWSANSTGHFENWLALESGGPFKRPSKHLLSQSNRCQNELVAATMNSISLELQIATGNKSD